MLNSPIAIKGISEGARPYITDRLATEVQGHYAVLPAKAAKDRRKGLDFVVAEDAVYFSKAPSEAPCE
jgi:hypothetical protein